MMKDRVVCDRLHQVCEVIYMDTAEKFMNISEAYLNKDCETEKIKESKNIVTLLTPKAFLSYLESQCSLRQGLEKMRNHGFAAMPVVAKDGTYMGTVSEGDFLWQMLDNDLYTLKEQEKISISTIIRKGWNPPVKISATMDDILLRVMEQNFVPVIDDREKFMGIITRKSVIQYYYLLLKRDEV
jgi:predicted transcriptional regulator